MEITTNSTDSVDSTSVRDTWRRLVITGTVLIILGLVSALTPVITGVALSVVLGVFLVVGGIAHFVHAFSGRDWTGLLSQVILGIVFVVGGIALVTEPYVGLFTLTALLIGFFLVDGIVEIVMGARLRPYRGWLSIVGSGVLSLVIGGLIWMDFPSSAQWAVGLLFGIGLFTSGVSIVITAIGGRNAVRNNVTTTTTDTGH